MKTKWITFAMTIILLGLWRTGAEAAYTFTSTETDTTPVIFTMKDTPVSVTFQIKNTSTGANVDERIYQVRFRINTYGTVFLNTTAAPAGWTRTAFSTTSITFRANTANDAIVCTTAGCAAGPTTSVNFTLNMTAGTSTTDVTQHLRDVRAYFQNATAPWPPTGSDSRITLNSGASIGSWTLKALRVTGFQITDLSGVPISSITAGTSFKLVMTIRNDSSTTQSTITTNPNPPTAVKTGTVTQGLTSTVYSPNPLTLAAGASGTITFTYSTNASDAGTIYFTANARNNANTSTSKTATSTTLSVGKFVASINLSATCVLSGQNLTVTMTLTDNYTNNIINVTPTLTPSAGAPITLTSGPTPAPPNGPVTANGGTFVFTWVYQITGTYPQPSFFFTGSAVGTEQTGGSGTARTTPNVTSSTVTYGGYSPTVTPSSVNTNSTNQELSWTITNNGCADVKQVQITVPAGWGTPATDTYSMIEQFNPPNPGTTPIEDVWTVSGANPVNFAATILPPSASANILPLIGGSPKDGSFNLVFPSTPASAGTGTFQITITDTNNVSVTRTTDVTVNAFNTGSPNPNSNGTGATREDFP